MAEHLADRFDLVRQVLDAREPLETEQLVEPAQQSQSGQCQMLAYELQITASRSRGKPFDLESHGNAARRGPARVLHASRVSNHGRQLSASLRADHLPPPYGPR